MCENTNGSFECVCPPGSEPFNNGTMCREGSLIILLSTSLVLELSLAVKVGDDVWYYLQFVEKISIDQLKPSVPGAQKIVCVHSMNLIACVYVRMDTREDRRIRLTSPVFVS
jgi:hypothetical protein